MSDMIFTQEYTDELTGTRLTVEYDIPEHPKLTVFSPEGRTISIEEFNEAIRRLLEMSAVVIAKPGLPPVPLAQQILDLAQSALITGHSWPEADRMHNLIEALEDIIKLCQEQLPQGKEEGV